VPFISVGAAGGKRGQAVEVADLAEVTHDPLLAQLRYRLRKHHGAPRDRAASAWPVCSAAKPWPRPMPSCASTAVGDGSLNCHGYGSVVSVTASFGMCAAGWTINLLAEQGANKLRGFKESAK
jgi:tRNA threonylcarbamoyladenosine dehydratase